MEDASYDSKSGDSTNAVDTIDVQLSDDEVTDTESVAQVYACENASSRPIRLPLRSGRSAKLPARF